MKQFFKMMFASVLGVLVAFGLLILIGSVILVGMAATMGSSPEYVPKANTVLKISLNGSLNETSESSPFDVLLGKTDKSYTLSELISAIRTAKENDNVKGIYLEAGSFAVGTASVEAIYRELKEFKESGKFLVAYGDYYSFGCYYICSLADNIMLNPQGNVTINGMASQTVFLKGLANKIGIDIQIFRVGTYKGAVEMFMLDKLSDENREQITSYMGGIWNNLLEGVSLARNIPISTLNEYADKGYSLAKAEKAVEIGVADELKYKPEAEAYVKELAGQSGDKLKTVGVDKFKNIKKKTKRKDAQIAVLYAEGQIMMSNPSPYSSRGALITETLAGELIKLKNDDKVKAVVMRVNSPGGSAFISDQIWREVVELKKVKPVVVSMGDMAASGGYYISCAANKIYAEKNTLTGSIGIFGMFPNATGLYKKLDVTTDIVKTNHFSDIGDNSRPWREDEKALFQSYIEEGYDTFISRCADGREMTKEEIDRVGQGRVWTGEQAKERGLVDEIGDLDDAISAASELAEIDDYETISVADSQDFFQKLIEKQMEDLKMSLVKDFLGDEFKQWQKLNQLKSQSGILALYPYEIDAF